MAYVCKRCFVKSDELDEYHKKAFANRTTYLGGEWPYPESRISPPSYGDDGDDADIVCKPCRQIIDGQYARSWESRFDHTLADALFKWYEIAWADACGCWLPDTEREMFPDRHSDPQLGRLLAIHTVRMRNALDKIGHPIAFVAKGYESDLTGKREPISDAPFYVAWLDEDRGPVMIPTGYYELTSFQDAISGFRYDQYGNQIDFSEFKRSA